MLLSRFKIVGHSMYPSFSENDNVLVSSIPFLFKKPKANDIVLFKKSDKFLLKRITRIKDSKYFLTGDNKSDSLDSRKFGFVTREQIKGKVIIKL